eukprot:Clim_evm77s109 gene=Clim_evmTU77s109
MGVIRLLLLIFLVCFSVFVALYWGFIAYIGAGYTAKVGCSGYFVGKRPYDHIRANEFRVLGVHSVDVIDDIAKTFTSTSFWGLGKTRTARYVNEYYGCTLGDEELVQKLRAVPVPPTDPKYDEIEWPAGNKVTPNSDPKYEALRQVLRKWTEHDEEGLFHHSTRAVVVVHKGKIVAESYQKDITPQTRLIGWSMTKSLLQLMVGNSILQGKLSLDDPSFSSPRKAHMGDGKDLNVKIRHLLNHHSGFNYDEGILPWGDTAVMLFGQDDVGHFCSRVAGFRPPKADVTKRFAYSSCSTNVVSVDIRRGLQEEYGKEQGDQAYWLWPFTFLRSLGMDSAVVEMDQAGNFAGSGFSFATPRDYAKMGYLMAKNGISPRTEERIIPEDWVEYSTTDAGDPDFLGRYGASWWKKTFQDKYADWEESRATEWQKSVPDDTFWAAGFEGQFTFVNNRLDLVVVRMGSTLIMPLADTGKLWQEILEALGPVLEE